MTPTIPLPTDNIYKFVCLFGLALILAAVYGFVALYSSSLERVETYSKAVIELQANTPPTEVDADRLKLAKAMLSVTTQNRQAGTWGIAVTLSIGLAMGFLGGRAWYHRIQVRDDEVSKLQLEKLRLEVEKLRLDSGGKGGGGAGA